jgi:MFS family permease
MSRTTIDSTADEESAPPDRPGGSARSYAPVIAVLLLLSLATTFSVSLFCNSLHFMAPPLTPAQLPWVISASLVVGGALQPLAGKLADVFGSEQLLVLIALVFMAGSLLGALTTSFVWVVVARVLQASAIALPGINFAFVRSYLPARMVPMGVGLLSTSLGLATAVGPLISGGLLAEFSYRSIFWFCFIYVGALLPLLLLVMPKTERGARQRIDTAGSALLTVALGVLLYGISRGPVNGWGDIGTVLALVVAVLLLLAFVVVERRTDEPMIDFKLLGGPALRNVLLVSMFAGCLVGAWGYIVPQLLETPAAPGIDYGFGLTAVRTGLVTLGLGLTAAVCGPIGGQLARRRSPREVMLYGTGIMVLSTLLAAFAHNQLWEFVLYSILFGVALGFYFASGPTLIIEAVPGNLTGVSSGMQQAASALTGAALPVVLTIVLEQNVLRTDPATHLVVYSSLGYRYAFLVLAACSAIGFVITLFMRHGRTPAVGGAAH